MKELKEKIKARFQSSQKRDVVSIIDGIISTSIKEDKFHEIDYIDVCKSDFDHLHNQVDADLDYDDYQYSTQKGDVEILVNYHLSPTQVFVHRKEEYS